MYKYICVCIYLYIYVCMYTLICIYESRLGCHCCACRVCLCVYISYMNIYVHKPVYPRIYTHTHLYVCVCRNSILFLAHLKIVARFECRADCHGGARTQLPSSRPLENGRESRGARR